MPLRRTSDSVESSTDERQSSRAESELQSGQEGFHGPLSQERASSVEEQDIPASGDLSEQDYESQRATTEYLERSGLQDQSASSTAFQFVINVPEVDNASEYEEIPENNTVDSVLEELDGPGSQTSYKVLFEDGREDEASLHPYSTDHCLPLGNTTSLRNMLHSQPPQSQMPALRASDSHKHLQCELFFTR